MKKVKSLVLIFTFAVLVSLLPFMKEGRSENLTQEVQDQKKPSYVI